MRKIIYSQVEPRIPAGTFYLKRLYVQKLLKKALQSPVVTVSAGKGYGKTWAVYASLLDSDSDCVNFWIQVTEEDNDGEHLWRNKSSTVSLYNPELGNTLIKMGFPGTSEFFDRYHRLLERVIKPEKKYVLIYDDFHLIHNAYVLNFVNQYLASPLPNMSSVLIYRGEPGIKSVSLLSKGLLARIGEEDLRFSREETAAYFAGQGIPLTKGEMDHVYRSTEGWPLLLNLIVQDAKDKQPGEKVYAPELIKIKTAKVIEDTFFSSLYGDMRKLLIKSSLIDHRPRELLEKLSPKKELAAGMDTVSSMIRYDPYIHGYRIHTFLLEFLEGKQAELSPEEIRQVYASAAEWCMENGLRTEAALYYERAGDYRGIVDVVCSFPGLMPEKTALFFLELIDRQSEKEGGSREGEDYLNLLRYIIRPKMLFALGRFEEAGNECRRIIGQFESLPLSPQNSKILAMNHICLGNIVIFTCRFTKDYHLLLPFFEKAFYYYERQPFQVEEPFTKCGILPYICQIGYPAQEGLFEFAIQKLVSLEPYAVKVLGGFLGGTSSLAWSEFSYFKGDVDAAEKYARQAVFLARKNRQYETETRALFFLLRISIHTRDQGEIETLFHQLEKQLSQKGYFSRFILYDIVFGWFHAQIGNTGRIAPWLKNSFEKSELSDMFRPFEILVKIKCSFSQKHYNAALQILENKNKLGGIESYYMGKLEITLLRSAARYHAGKTHAALVDLEEAYRIAAPQSFDMPFIELGEKMYLLAGVVLSSDKNSIPSEWLEKIRSRASVYGKKLNALAESFRQPGREASEQALPDNPPALVLRRLEAMILWALAQGFTREEIAQSEGISLNAVKENIKNLYEKLGALNRADAIRIANSMGLLRKFKKSSH